MHFSEIHGPQRGGLYQIKKPLLETADASSDPVAGLGGGSSPILATSDFACISTETAGR